jgi:hypothetical protein
MEFSNTDLIYKIFKYIIMKLKLTSRSFLYIALLAILIIVFYYGVQFIGTLTEGLQVMTTNKRCSGGRRGGRKCHNYCKKLKDIDGNKFKTGTCCKGNKCICGTRKC